MDVNGRAGMEERQVVVGRNVCDRLGAVGETEAESCGRALEHEIGDSALQ